MNGHVVLGADQRPPLADQRPPLADQRPPLAISPQVQMAFSIEEAICSHTGFFTRCPVFAEASARKRVLLYMHPASSDHTLA